MTEATWVNKEEVPTKEEEDSLLSAMRLFLVVALSSWCSMALVVPFRSSRMSVRLTAESESSPPPKRVPLYSTPSTDALIEELASLAPFELPAKVSQEAMIRKVSAPEFFLRIAELCDEAEDDEERINKLKALADNLSTTLSAVAKRVIDREHQATEILAEVVAAAAEDDGEFLMPLNKEKLDSLRAAVKARLEEGTFDETILRTINTVSKKAEKDNLPGVVALLRKVLQVYAAEVLAFDPEQAKKRSETVASLVGDLINSLDEEDAKDREPELASDVVLLPDYEGAIACYGDLMAADADYWDLILRTRLLPLEENGDEETVQLPTQDVRKDALLTVVQGQIEQVVLLQENGSYAQQVQAEFLRELVVRIETTRPEIIDGKYLIDAILENNNDPPPPTKKN